MAKGPPSIRSRNSGHGQFIGDAVDQVLVALEALAFELWV